MKLLRFAAQRLAISRVRLAEVGMIERERLNMPPARKIAQPGLSVAVRCWGVMVQMLDVNSNILSAHLNETVVRK